LVHGPTADEIDDGAPTYQGAHLKADEDSLLNFLENIANAELDNNPDTVMPSLILKSFNDFAGRTLKRNACLAHLLQLAIRDSINSNPAVVSISKKVNDIVKFINNSNKCLADLRSKTGGLSLVKPCATRWNSVYYCLKRILRDDNVKFSFTCIPNKNVNPQI